MITSQTTSQLSATPVTSPEDYAEIQLLFRRVAAEDRVAFHELHRRFSGMVFGTAYQVLHNQEDTEDVVQEVFAQLWKKADLYCEERGKPTTWLATLARNRAIDKFRSRGRRNRLNDHFEQEPQLSKGWEAPSPSNEAESVEMASETRSAVMQLAPEQRQAIQMAFFEGLTQAEIAEKTGAPLGTIKARIRRGLGKLRVLIRE